eukprot:2116356-Prymnesium_polylepis.1
MIATVGLGYDRMLSSEEVAEKVLRGKMPVAVCMSGCLSGIDFLIHGRSQARRKRKSKTCSPRGSQVG